MKSCSSKMPGSWGCCLDALLAMSSASLLVPRGDVQLPGQLNKHLRGGMQIFVKTLPPHKLSSQRGTTCIVSSDARPSPARRRQLGRASLPSPIKQEGHVGSALNAFVLRCQAIDLYTIQTFHLLCATVATPFCYKRRPEASRRGIRIFWAKLHPVASSRTQNTQIHPPK